MNGRDAEDVLQAVLGRLEGVRQQGGYWMARCPAHEDGRASLSVKRGERQPVVFNCHAGCNPQDVANAIGLDISALCAPRAEPDQDHADDMPAGAVRAYVYHDSDGRPVFRKLRYEPKDFKLQRWDGSRWTWGGLGSGPKPVYRLPDVIAAVKAGRTVYVCEGEKDADAVRRAGAVATCNFDGAAKEHQRPKVRAEYAEPFRGGDVIVVADDDEPGMAHAKAWGDVLRGGGAARVRLAKPAVGKDTYDHLTAGHGLSELVIFDDSADEDEDAELPDAPPFPAHLARGPIRDMIDWADADGLPVSYMAASCEVAIATACAVSYELDGRPVGSGAVLRLTATRTVMPVLWAALLGGSGDGKNPPGRIATQELRDRTAAAIARWHDIGGKEVIVQDGETKEIEIPRPESIVKTSATMEAIGRWLMRTKGSGLMFNGELASFLRGLGQYKGGGGSDRYDAMDMWSGEAIDISRVGDGGSRNAVHIYVPNPRMSVLGGLVDDNLSMLGNESDGLRARFLPVLPSSEVRPNLDGSEPLPDSWARLFNTLFLCNAEREWHLRGDARDAMSAAVTRWTERKRNGSDPKTVQTFLAKADEHALRLALVAAESERPGEGGDVPLWAVEYAIARVEYSIGVWLALGSDQVMAFSRKDEILGGAVAELLRRIEKRNAESDGRRYMTIRDIQMAAIKGAKSKNQVQDLVNAYLAEYPGTVFVYSDKHHVLFPRARKRDRSECPAASTRGPAPVIVYAPRRGAVQPSPTPPVQIGKTVESTVSGMSTGTQRRSGTAGQRGSGGSREPEKLLTNTLINSFPSTVSGGSDGRPVTGRAGSAGGHGLPLLRCPECGAEYRTAIVPGDGAYCSACGHEWTSDESDYRS